MSSARWLTIDPDGRAGDALGPAVDWLRAGGIVAFPTDTFYGLAVNPRDPDAVRRLFDLKGRSPRAALPLIAGSAAQVVAWSGAFGPVEARLAARYWPGPLSLVRDAPLWLGAEVHAGRRTVAIRVPAHGVARRLCELFGEPLPATSANLSGQPPANGAADLGLVGTDDRVLVIDAGLTPGGLPSTMVDARGASPILVRVGAIPFERVLESLNE